MKYVVFKKEVAFFVFNSLFFLNTVEKELSWN